MTERKKEGKANLASLVWADELGRDIVLYKGRENGVERIKEAHQLGLVQKPNTSAVRHHFIDAKPAYDWTKKIVRRKRSESERERMRNEPSIDHLTKTKRFV